MHAVSKGKVVLACLVTLLVLGLSLFLFEVAVSPRQARHAVSNKGVIKTVGVGVYSDSNCGSKLSSIDWGMLEPGQSLNVTGYIRNEATSAVTLSLSTANWSPSNASQYITLKWDYGGISIAPNEVVKVTFMLAVSENISGITNFSFDIAIISTG